MRVREVSVSRMEYFLSLTNHLLHVGGLRADGKPSLVVSVHEVLLARGAAASPAEDLGHSDCTLWVGDLKAQRTQNSIIYCPQISLPVCRCIPDTNLQI